MRPRVDRRTPPSVPARGFSLDFGRPMDISRGVADDEPVTQLFRPAVILISVAAAVTGSILLATHDSTSKVTTRGVTATLHTPGHPGWLAADEDALWVALTDNRTTVRTRPLLRLDLASGAIKQRLSLGGRVTYLMHLDRRLLASVEYNGSRGSGPSLIVALDWRTGRLLARREFPALIGPLTESGRNLWALQVGPAALLRLDPLTLAPTAAPIRLSQGRAAGLAAAGGYLWTSEPTAGDVIRVDTATRSVTRAHVGGFPIGVIVAGGNVWFADRDGGKVGRLDPRTLRPVGKPVQVGGKAWWLASAVRYLFAADPARRTVARLD